jgi:hypothetical protein
MNSSRRAELIDEVRYGRISPEEAEKEVERLGLEKLASEPDKSLFDPVGETWWTLHMAVAWIAWRTTDKVRQYWDKYRRECWDWHYRDWKIAPDGAIHSGYFLEQRRNSNLWFMQREETLDAGKNIMPHETNVAYAQAKLWNVLSERVVHAVCDTPDPLWRGCHARGRLPDCRQLYLLMFPPASVTVTMLPKSSLALERKGHFFLVPKHAGAS